MTTDPTHSAETNLISNKPLLMLIDLQRAIDDPAWGDRNNPDAEMNISALLSEWRKLGLPLLHVKHMSTDPTSGYYPGTPGNDFKNFSLPRSSENVLEKDTNSAFIRTDLHRSLQCQGISEIVMVGVITNNSVEATARMAGNLGYRTIVVSDGTYTFNRQDYAGNECTAEVVHNLSLANLQGEYAEVCDAEHILTLIQRIQND